MAMVAVSHCLANKEKAKGLCIFYTGADLVMYFLSTFASNCSYLELAVDVLFLY